MAKHSEYNKTTLLNLRRIAKLSQLKAIFQDLYVDAKLNQLTLCSGQKQFVWSETIIFNFIKAPNRQWTGVDFLALGKKSLRTKAAAPRQQMTFIFENELRELS